MTGDNFHFDIRADGQEILEHAIKIAFAGTPSKEATHYHINNTEGRQTLVLLWHEEKDAIQLPFVLNAKNAVGFITSWLENAHRPDEPSHDGDNHPGFRIFVDKWSRVNGWTYSFVGVEFAWMMYGK